MLADISIPQLSCVSLEVKSVFSRQNQLFAQIIYVYITTTVRLSTIIDNGSRSYSMKHTDFKRIYKLNMNSMGLISDFIMQYV